MRTRDETDANRAPAERLAWLTRAALVVAALAGIAVLAMASATMIHALPVGDDFGLAAAGRKMGFVDYGLVKMYQHWTGRWFGSGLLVEILPELDFKRQYWMPLFAIAAVQIGALWVGVRALFSETLSHIASLALAIATSALLWNCRPAPYETVTWLCGAVPYDLGLSLAVLTLAGSCRLAGLRSAPRWLGVLVLSALGIIVSGTHEFYGALLCGWMSAGLLVTFRLRHSLRAAWATIWAFTMAGLVFVMRAPGNRARADRGFGESASVERTLELLRGDLFETLPRWSLDPKLLTASLALLLLLGAGRSRPAWLSEKRIPWTTLFLVTWLGLMTLSLAASHWSTGWHLRGRLEDCQYAAFFVSWLATLFVLAHRFPMARRLPPNALAVARTAALLALSLASVRTGNFSLARLDYHHGRVAEWRRVQFERYDTCETAKREKKKAVVMPRSTVHPAMYMRDNLTEKGTSPMNMCWARFYGLKRVRLEPKKEKQAQ